MTMTDLQNCIDFFLNAVLNVWNVFKTASPVIFAILVGLCLYPVFRRIMRSMRGNK